MTVNCCSTRNTTLAPGRNIRYIVIHYTAGTTSRQGTAQAVCRMFASGSVQASADFVVDDKDICQYNPDLKNRYTWAVGGNRYGTKGGGLYGVAKNSNTISIELCSCNSQGRVRDPNDPSWYFTTAVLENGRKLVAELMYQFNIPVERVIRHYDCTGKPCPGIIGFNKETNEMAWEAFKKSLPALREEEKQLTEYEVRALCNQIFNERIASLADDLAGEIVRRGNRALGADDCPEWAEEAWDRAVADGVTDGRRPAALMTRAEGLVMMHRLFAADGK